MQLHLLHNHSDASAWVLLTAFLFNAFFCIHILPRGALSFRGPREDLRSLGSQNMAVPSGRSNGRNLDRASQTRSKQPLSLRAETILGRQTPGAPARPARLDVGVSLQRRGRSPLRRSDGPALSRPIAAHWRQQRRPALQKRIVAKSINSAASKPRLSKAHKDSIEAQMGGDKRWQALWEDAVKYRGELKATTEITGTNPNDNDLAQQLYEAQLKLTHAEKRLSEFGT